jgi:hypothetical protein
LLYWLARACCDVMRLADLEARNWKSDKHPSN